MGLKNWETSELHFWLINDVEVKEAARAVASQGVEALEDFCSEYVWAALRASLGSASARWRPVSLNHGRVPLL